MVIPFAITQSVASLIKTNLSQGQIVLRSSQKSAQDLYHSRLGSNQDGLAARLNFEPGIGVAPSEGKGSTFMPAYPFGGNMDLRDGLIAPSGSAWKPPDVKARDLVEVFS